MFTPEQNSLLISVVVKDLLSRVETGELLTERHGWLEIAKLGKMPKANYLKGLLAARKAANITNKAKTQQQKDEKDTNLDAENALADSTETEIDDLM